MGESTKAVFLSYAREDAAAASRIADALRSSGVEVWFDQNELRGGDKWDAKIRQQINDCTLFLPVISSHTQERNKGYFRLEWKLAVEQTHLMAEGVAFLAPVVVDDTPEGGALVPPEFLRVQWTRLPGALPTPQFVGQVKRLLAGEKGAGSKEPGGKTLEAGRPRPAERGVDAASPGKPAVPGWMWAVAAVVLAAVAVGIMLLRKPELPVAPLPAVAEAKPAGPSLPRLSDKSIAVLPFANLSTEKENEFFADGVHDDVITSLAKIRDLKVISRTSVLAYRDTASRNLKKIAEELGVATILEGSIRRVGSKVHMNAQLIDARTDEHLWADTFDGDTSDIFALQARLAQQIASALKATLTPSERTSIERRPTQNQEAYDLYLRARAMHQEQGEGGTPADFERIIAVYEQAIAKDPSFALAHVQVALVHDILYWFAYLDPSAARAAKSKAAVDAAVRLAPDLPETHLALGAYYYRIDRNWDRALAEFRAAEPGLPNDAQLFFWLAVTHRRLGRWQEALGYFERAIALNPRELASVTNHAEFLVELRRWEQAGDATRRYRAYFPDDSSLFYSQAQAQFGLDGDRAAFAKTLASVPHGLANRAGLDASGNYGYYRVELLSGNLAAADHVLSDPELSTFSVSHSNVIRDPVSFRRALLAFERGDRESTRRFAEDARIFFQTGQWNARQRPWVRMRLAMITAWTGDPAEALREAQTAMADDLAGDVYDATVLRPEFGAVLLSLDRREEAFGCLHEMMSGPCPVSPNEIRIDLLWSRLKADPRFEEILQAAKPL